MGGRKSLLFRRRRRRAPPPIPISIPGFPFPPNILDYLMSQSGGFVISFTTPQGATGNVPTQTNSIVKSVSKMDDEFAFTYSQPKKPQSSTLAYNTTLAPTPAPIPTNPVSPPIVQPVSAADLPGNIPPVWVAAIRAMEYVTRIGPITSYDEIEKSFSDIAEALPSYSGAAAMIYLCVAITKMFEPFQSNFVYNYLNQTYPNIFIDASAYQKILIIHTFSQKFSRLMSYSPMIPGNGYVSVNDRVMIYVVPEVIKSIMDRLINSSPLSNVSQ